MGFILEFQFIILLLFSVSSYTTADASARPESDASEDTESTHLGFFGDRKAMYDAFKEEGL